MSGDSLAQGTNGPEKPSESAVTPTSPAEAPAVQAYAQAAAAAQRTRRNWPVIIWFGAAIAAVIIDRVLKAVALAGMETGRGWLQFVLFKNIGVAFSLPLPPKIFWPIAIPIFVVLLFLFVRAWRRGAQLKAGMFFCVLLGSASNLMDRAMYGWTTDYLLFFNRSAVNIADGMIIVGLVAIGWMAGEEHEGAATAKK